MNTGQKIRECEEEICKLFSAPLKGAIREIVGSVLTRHFGQPEQWPKQENVDKLVALCFPAQVSQTNEQKHDADEFFKQPFEQTEKLLDEIVAEYLGVWMLKRHGIAISDALRQACTEYAATKPDPHHYFKVHEVGRPLPIHTEILLNDGRWVEACSWPQYDATINYQARVKKGTK